jgi:hypothetical protein
MRLIATLLSLFLALLFMSTPARADLIGSHVTGTLFFPDLSTVFAGPVGPVTVGPGIEFPTLAFDGTVDITGSQIIWTATLSVTYGSGAFNGFDLLFSGAPTITNVTVDGSTTLPPVSVSFTGNDVKFNLAGLSATAGQKTILDVQTSASAAPEPATGLMTLLVLLGFMWHRVRRFGHR